MNEPQVGGMRVQVPLGHHPFAHGAMPRVSRRNATNLVNAPITVTGPGLTNAYSTARCAATLRRSGRSHAL
jgi:hypothetical protein